LAVERPVADLADAAKDRLRCAKGHIAPSRSGSVRLAAVESDLKIVMGQLGRLPTRRDLAKAALGIIISIHAR
jgi:hypothetical protein